MGRRREGERLGCGESEERLGVGKSERDWGRRGEEGGGREGLGIQN